MKREVSFSPPDISEDEIRRVTEVLRSGWITTGPQTAAFERELTAYCGTADTVCLSSATAALELTLRLLGIGAGDEVITTAYTYTATASVIAHVGAKIVLIDTKKDTPELDYDRMEAAISARTKAILPVDLAGVPCDYARIYKAVENQKSRFTPASPMQERLGRIAVIADAAHALGAERGGKRVGGLADFTCFSFHAVKNLTTAEGGAVTWREHSELDNAELRRQYRLLSLHGQDKDALAKSGRMGWEYDILTTGYKANMTDVMAAIGRGQLARYDAILARRRQVVARYERAFADCANLKTLSHQGADFESSRHLYLTWIRGADEQMRNRLIAGFADAGVAVNVHYKPLPLLTAYRALGFSISDFPNAFGLYRNELTLPLTSAHTDAEIEYVIDVYTTLLKEYGLWNSET